MHSKETVPSFNSGETLQDRYRIVRQLGAGGMGAVYEAIDDRLQATVAIKVIAHTRQCRDDELAKAALPAQISPQAIVNRKVL